MSTSSRTGFRSLRPFEGAQVQPTVTYLDVRSPSEFAAGAIPGSVNLPILSDDERRLVGTCYKANGRDAAIRLGESLVSGELRVARIAAWQALAKQYPNVKIVCARGGLRSRIAARWLVEHGVDLARVAGGYKALRNECLTILDALPTSLAPMIIGGRTGSGKTDLIRGCEHALDLEGLAKHRGSAFGAFQQPQPSQATFENRIAHELSRLAPGQRVAIEDESRAIGSRSVPPRLYEAMAQAPILVVELDRVERAARIYQEYIVEALRHASSQALRERHLNSLGRIKKRLGGVNHARIGKAIESAFERGEREAHLVWISLLLEHYYDPMYDHGLKRKASRICFRGSPEAIRAKLKTPL